MRKLKLVHLEDSLADSELLTAMLDSAYDLELLRVDSEEAFRNAILIPGVDLIISDFTLPSYSGGMALARARAECPEIPFIFFSGTIGEEAAINALRSGAIDYILKHRPQRMLAAIDRALRESDERKSRIEAEAALKRSQESFRVLIENALDIISVIDSQGHFTYNSPSIEKVLGYTAQELRMKNAFSLIHADDLPLAHAAFARALAGPNESVTAELRVCHKNGHWRNLELIGKSLDAGSELRGVVVNSRDVTEKRQTEAQLLRAQRMECLGVLAGGIAHDLNNILAPIMMGSELLKDLVSDQDALSVIETIQASSERGSDIVKQVLSFARGVKGNASMFDLKPLVHEVVKLLRETFPKGIQFQLQFSDHLQNVVCNPTELHQILMNLCINARDAMPNGGLLQIKAANATIDAAGAKQRPEAQPGAYVCLTIADTGTGIPAELLSRVFEPFFTTKEEGSGTGLGLSTVLSIVKRNGGFLEIQSTVDEGTQFDIFLPAAENEEAGASVERTVFRDGHGERILLVDDESAILEMAKVVLENSNYSVVLASEGVQALRTLMTQPGAWDLVITDASMPIMDGATLTREIRRIAGHGPIICTTGQSSGALQARIAEAGVDCILQKPYTAQQLLLAVSTILNRPRAQFVPAVHPQTCG